MSEGSPPPTLDDAAGSYQRTMLGKFDTALLRTKAAKGILAMLLAAALIVPSIQASTRIRKSKAAVFRESGERQKSALGRWLPDARVLADGSADPYGSGHWFPTPPFVLMCLVPFCKMGYALAGIIWSGLKVIGFVAAMAFLINSMRRGGLRIPLGVMVAAGIFSIRPIISDLQHANLNLFVIIWIALAWGLYVRGRDVAAGILLALAIVTKITPALLLIYFLYKRQWRLCIGAAVGLIAFFIVLPGLYIGFDRNLRMLGEWNDMIVAPYLFHGWAAFEIANQSLYGTLLRVLSNAHILSIEHMPTDQAFAAGMEEMARPLTSLGRLLRPAITLSILGSLAWLCRHRYRSRGDIRQGLELALVLLAMLLMGERTWKHHATTLPIIYVIFWYALTCLPWPDRFRACHVAGLGVQFLLLVAAGEGIMGDRFADIMLDGGAFCWGLLLLAVQISILLAARRSLAGAGPKTT